ncbi:MAG: MFS transporter [Gemmatimonadaceae bacterium]|nr:MFS transporter [Gemmatimonadaceae bacterium]
MTAPARSFNPFHTLQRHPNFRRFWFGQTASLIGTWMHSVAAGWLALELSNDPFIVGVVSAAGTLPVLLFSLPGGLVADRFERLRVVQIAQLALFVEAVLMFWLAWSGRMTVSGLIALSLLNGTLAAFEIPARQSLIVELVGKEDLLDAIALNSGGFNLARIAGPSIAALVIAQLGIAWCFGLDALSYGFVLWGLSLIRVPPREAHAIHSGGSAEGIGEVLRYVRETRLMWILVRVVAVFSILGIPVLTLLPVLARDRLGLDASGYGLLMTCVGVGAMGGALVMAAARSRIARGPWLATSSIVLPLFLIGVALARVELVAALLLVGVGAAMIINNAIINGRLQEIVPERLRGRVLAVYVTVYIGLTPVGSFLAGWGARHVGPGWAIGASATALLAFAVWCFRRYPELMAD